jgi:hypothetical protein
MGREEEQGDVVVLVVIEMATGASYERGAWPAELNGIPLRSTGLAYDGRRFVFSTLAQTNIGVLDLDRGGFSWEPWPGALGITYAFGEFVAWMQPRGLWAFPDVESLVAGRPSRTIADRSSLWLVGSDDTYFYAAGWTADQVVVIDPATGAQVRWFVTEDWNQPTSGLSVSGGKMHLASFLGGGPEDVVSSFDPETGALLETVGLPEEWDPNLAPSGLWCTTEPP